MSARRLRRGSAGGAALLALWLAGCAGTLGPGTAGQGTVGQGTAGPGAPVAPEAPLPPTPPPAAQVLASSAAGRAVRLAGRLPLRLQLPPGYELQVDHSDTFDVYHIWRVPPPPLQQDTSLEILVGQPQLAYCLPGTGTERPAAFPRWEARWHLCEEQGTQRPIWETHLLPAAPAPIHIFIIGRSPEEIERLVHVAETLLPEGG
jgi:hypothetical protein